MKYFLALAVSLGAMSAAIPAYAQESGQPYIRGNVGYGVHTNDELAQSIFQGRQDSDWDLATSVGLGYKFGDNSRLDKWRVELDADMLEADLGEIGSISNLGELKTRSLMLNLIREFDTGSDFTPYMGLGIGRIEGEIAATADNIAGTNNVCIGGIAPGFCHADDKDSVWGAQGLLGFDMDITRNLKWDTHAFYQVTDPDGFDFEATYTPTGTSPLTAISNSAEMDPHIFGIMTGATLLFGGSKAVTMPKPAPAPKPTYACWNGAMVFNASECAPRPAPEPVPEPVQTYSCWDGTVVSDLSACAPRPQVYTCWDGSSTTDLNTCPPQQTVVETLSYNNCGPSNVNIFDVPLNATPKQMSRLGTMPEFGDSHGLTPGQFYQKLQTAYSTNATHKAYLNYLFKQMGYSNGFADAQEYMFSEEVLPVGTRGILGLGEEHHFQYSILPSTQRDREAFRIQSANGTVVHFMKTCGNYMYACN